MEVGIRTGGILVDGVVEAAERREDAAQRLVPSAACMHAAFVLTGLGTVLLGPILPLLAQQWQMSDAQSGLLFWVKFFGAFLGGALISRYLRASLLLGMAAAAIGFGEFALSPSAAWACAGLLVSGFGLGQIIVSVNMIAGRRYADRRGSALALLNFSWSFGALLAALLAAWLTPRFPLRTLLLGFAGMFLVVGAALVLESAGAAKLLEQDKIQPDPAHGLARTAFFYFAGLLFLYGGLETCLAGWLTTFALRYGDRSLMLSQYATLLLLLALTAGRALTSLLLLRCREAVVQRVALGCTVLFIIALMRAQSAGSIALWSVALGLSLAPFFPTTFSLLMAEQPVAREAGIVVAVSGLGAALLPWAMGVLSTHTGSLQRAMLVPMGAALVLLGMSCARAGRRQPQA